MKEFEGFHSVKKLAEGHEHVIYSACRDSDKGQVVLKALRSEYPAPDVIALMYHEYEVVKDLDVPGIIKTFELIDKNHQYALVQEDMQGISLHEYLLKNPIKELPLFFKLAIQMTRIIKDLHGHDIIHKDIKPANFIIDPKTLNEKLTDFNFSSKLLHEMQDIVPPSKLEGTLFYMAPEQTGRMNMNLDYRADFYSLGVTFYEMLSGKLPFLFDDPLELLHAHLANPMPDLASEYFSIPLPLIEIVQKLMSKHPIDRYQSATGLEADLERCLEALEKTGEVKSFPLGEKDVIDHLNLAEKLYGREKEAKVLLEAYERTSQGAVEALMISGYSGIGKTMLINEVHKPMVEHKGYFISGKFDQLQRNTPYTAITQAFNQLARLILAEPEGRFESIKKGMTSSLESVGQIMIDLAPDIELIIGPQPPLEKLASEETKNRMMTFFKRFLRSVASEEHPLVIFIDDLQWIDSGSLKLFEYILTDDELTHVLLIGAYRDNEVDEQHLLTQFFKEMQTRQRKVASLTLGPLTAEHFEAFFKDSFKRDEVSITALAELVHKRTEGNPFFCKQLIGTVYREKLLYFDYDRRQWDWNLEGITALRITDNVVDLMLERLNKLPETTQNLIKLAACIGNRFTIETVMAVSGKTAEEIGRALWPALREELIVSLLLGYKRIDGMRQENLTFVLSKGISYQFAHDRIQQAAYQGISESEKQKLHLNIARLLVEKEPEASKKERLFEVTDHFNQSHELLSETEKYEVAGLNYQAAMVAQKANAYQAMEKYLTAAKNLMDDSWWDKHYDLAFNVNLEKARNLYLLNRDTELEKFVSVIADLAKTDFEKARVYQILVTTYHKRGNLQKAFETAKLALGFLGVKFNIDPTSLSVLKEVLKVRLTLRRFNVETLDTELPEISNSSIDLAFELLIELISPSIFRGQNSFRYLMAKAMSLLLKYGKPKSAGFWISAYGITVFFLFHDIEGVFGFWKIAERLSQESRDKYSVCETYFLHAIFVSHIRNHHREARAYLQHAIDDALVSGNIIPGVYSTVVRLWTVSGEAKSLKETIAIAEIAIKNCRDNGVSNFIPFTTFLATIPKNLSMDDPEKLTSLQEFEEMLKNVPNPLIRSFLYRQLCFYHYFLESTERSSHYYQLWEPLEMIVHYEAFSNEVNMLNALVMLKQASQEKGIKRWRHLKKTRQIMKNIKWSAKHNPTNYLHHYLFLKGSHLKLKGRFEEAIVAFDQAIINAKKGDFNLWAALGNELAAEMLIEQKRDRFAIDYIREAHYFYNLYGMMIKVKSLEKRYPECFIERAEVRGGVDIEGRPTRQSTITTKTTSAGLDFMSVIKASQTISGEIILDKLFEKILNIVLENAAAQKALFLERDKDSWKVTASIEAQGEGKFKILNIPLKDFQDIPESMVQFSIRTQETVVLSNANEDNQYGHDPYIVRRKPKSVLCLPIVHHDNVVGVIYLENNLTIGAFAEDRLPVLNALASQIAISLENSHYLDHMKRLYQKTERFVPKSFLEILKKKNIEEVELGDGMQIDLTAMFADIRNFTALSEELGPTRLSQLLNTYLGYMAPIIRKQGGFVEHFLGDGILALFPRTSDDAVRAALSMQKELSDFNKEIVEKGFLPIEIGIGVNYGPAMLSILGEPERLDANVVSDAINATSRIEGLNKYYKTQLLIGETVYQQLHNPKEYLIRIVDKVRAKGKLQSMRIYEVKVKPTDEALLQSEELFATQFTNSFLAYEKGDFKAASKGFSDCLSQHPDDVVALLFKSRCAELQKTGIPENWDGAVTLLEK